MDKIKVSFNLKKNLDEIKCNIEDEKTIDSIDWVLNYHKKNTWSAYPFLNELSLEQLAKALLIGYELEKTPEEKIKELYDKPVRQVFKEFDEGFKLGILKSLEFLNIEIKGINA